MKGREGGGGWKKVWDTKLAGVTAVTTKVQPATLVDFLVSLHHPRLSLLRDSFFPPCDPLSLSWPPEIGGQQQQEQAEINRERAGIVGGFIPGV